MAGPTAGLLTVLTMCTLCLGSELGERTGCPYREEVRTFGKGADQFNMTVAVGGQEVGCGTGRQCKALSAIVLYYENGEEMEQPVIVAWLCVAKNLVGADPGRSLEDHVGERGVAKQACQAFRVLRRQWRSARKTGKLNKQERRSLRERLTKQIEECRRQMNQQNRNN